MENSLFRSQWGQDKFIFENIFNFNNGCFFEVGAHDGESLSNTFFFEKELNWHGILVEMQPQFSEAIKIKRPNSKFFNCGLSEKKQNLLWFNAGDRSGLLRYYEASGFEYLENYYNNKDLYPNFDVNWVQSRPIMDVISESEIDHIDYFSLDVEGAEISILKTIDFNNVSIDLFTIEDNITPWIEHRKLLDSHGYTFIGALGVDGFFMHDRLKFNLIKKHSSNYLELLTSKMTPLDWFLDRY